MLDRVAIFETVERGISVARKADRGYRGILTPAGLFRWPGKGNRPVG